MAEYLSRNDKHARCHQRKVKNATQVVRILVFIVLVDGASGRGDSRPEIGALLADGASDGGALHFTFGVDNDATVV